MMDVVKTVEFKVNSKEEAEKLQKDMQKAMNMTIFSPDKVKERWFHKSCVKLFKWSFIKIDKILANTSPGMRRWNRIHLVLKNWVMYPGLKFIDKVIGKHLIKDFNELSPDWWNNHLRMYYYNWGEATKDIWKVWNYNQHQTNPNAPESSKSQSPEDIINNVIKTRSYKARKLICDIHCTIISEDTADRFWLNDFMLRNAHSIMEFYGVSEEERKKVPTYKTYPIYLSGSKRDPEYFVRNMDNLIWNPIKKEECDKDGKKPKSRCN